MWRWVVGAEGTWASAEGDVDQKEGAGEGGVQALPEQEEQQEERIGAG